MKSYLVILLIVITAQVSEAQESETYKPAAGQHNLEVQLRPLSTAPIAINGIRYRKFISPNEAIRLNAFLNMSSETTISQQADKTNNIPALEDKYSQIGINLRPGYEKHLAGTDRLSPYFGGELDIAIQGSKYKEEYYLAQEVEHILTKNENGFWRFGVNAVAGFDYYIAKQLYLGSEIGFGFSFVRNRDVKTEYSNKNAFGVTENPDPFERGSAFNFGPNANAAIRLGYIF